MSNEGYHLSRFAHDPRRKALWQALAKYFFQKDIRPDDTVLDLGAGYGEFINSVRARRRIAVDIWPGMLDYLDQGVEGIVGRISELDSLEDGSIDYVFASNCFEHVAREELMKCLAVLQRKMKAGAMLSVVQPNFRYCYRQYFDDYTHVGVYTEVGLADLLTSAGFQVVRRMGKFLPLTLKGRWPVHPALVRLYLMCPFKPLAGQMLIQARR